MLTTLHAHVAKSVKSCGEEFLGGFARLIEVFCGLLWRTAALDDN